MCDHDGANSMVSDQTRKSKGKGSGDSPLEDDEVGYSHARYKDTPWCSPIKVKYGDVYCRAPQGGYYKTALGTRCDIRCRKGYELHGSSQLICQSNRRWSDKVICKQKRCPVLAMPANGGFKCVDGAYFNSRCEYYCSPGYTLKGERTVTCMDNKAWSGRPASCVDIEPPRIKCPSVKERIAEPNKLTVRVSWETPEGRDTADGILTEYQGLVPCSAMYRVHQNLFALCGQDSVPMFLVSQSRAPLDLSWVRPDICQNCRSTELQGALSVLYPEKFSLDSFKVNVSPIDVPQQAQCGLDLRHITVVELVGVFPTLIGRIGAKIMPPALALQLRLLLRIPLYSFSMVLVDKHGMDKERYVSLVMPVALFNLIDTFPLRKEEMVLQAEMGQTCNT
ncbi:sushi repeat-containing protein SRPX [Puma concolor]|uniref:Sushi repeat-containing protein SRPX n=1 Tax=Puma concolor TaxID=9696 RepID=A0A6P6IPY7_PUMCO|nr:sushi repeat-containing protein SRPX [Puma concolor]